VTAELDSANAARVIDLIREASGKRGLTVLMVTHDPELAAQAERRMRLLDGVVVEA
jgi:ABC-type lipoprotein export system ATPase subunit